MSNVEALRQVHDRIVAEFAALSEDDKSYVIGSVIRRCDFAGSVFTRGDLEEALGRTLTADEWERITDSYSWGRALEDRMTEQGWDVIHPLLERLEIKSKDELDEEGEQVGA